jgi:hypothetical protein
MRRIALFLFVMSFTGVAFASAASTNSISNFFLGNSTINGQGLNQVLSLLVGPQGAPGPAGVAGRDGAVGLNGADGAPGATGPQGPAGAIGPAGPQGATGANGANGLSVSSVALASGSSNCPNGGVKYVDGNNNTTYVCNGANGATGATGANGKDGTNGSSGSTQAGFGAVTAGTCAPNVNVNFQGQFNSNGLYTYKQVVVSGIPSACNGQNLTLSFAVETSTVVASPGSAKYAQNNVIDCKQAIASIPSGSTGNVTFDAASTAASPCNVYPNSSSTTSSGTVGFSDMYTRDFTDNFGIQIAP